MNLTTVEAFDLNGLFRALIESVFEEGHIYKIDKGSSEGRYRLEFDYVTMRVHNPGMRPLYPDVPDGLPAPASMDQIEEYYQNKIVNTEVQPNERYTYGQFLVPQIITAIERYKADGPGCNQLTMTVGDMTSMSMPDPPCLRMIDTRINKFGLHFIVYFRSWDLWAGLPANLGGLQLLKEYMAKEIGVRDGEIIASSKGLHLYDHQWQIAWEYLGRSVDDEYFQELIK